MENEKLQHISTKHDQHHIEKYEAFCTLYGVADVENFVKLYDIYDLVSFLPSEPTEEEKQIFNELVGVTNESVYMDYIRSTNTFELIMQWQERTGNLANNSLPFGKGEG